MAAKQSVNTEHDSQRGIDPGRLVVDLAACLRIAHQISGRVRLKLAPGALTHPALTQGGGTRLTQALAAIPGVRGIQLNLLAHSCVVEYDSRAIPDAAWPDLLAGRRSAAADTLLGLLASFAEPTAPRFPQRR